jgi:hypothetical protein
MMVLAVASTTWIQLCGVTVALLAALAAWAGVRQARDAAREVRDSEREARLPLLLLSRASVGSQGRPGTLALAVYNAGDVGADIEVILVGDGMYAYSPVGVMRPGETVNFGSNIPATEHSRAFAFGRSRDGAGWAWDHNRNRKKLSADQAIEPSREAIFATFHPSESLDALEPASLLRGDNMFF